MGKNCIRNKVIPKAISDFTFGDLYSPNKAIYAIDF